METTADIKKVILPVTGMSCAACAVSVESTLKHTAGVAGAGVNYANQSAWIDYNPKTTTLPDLDKALQGIGYGLIIEDDEEDAIAEQEKIQRDHYENIKRSTIASGLLSLPVVIIGMFFMDRFKAGNYIMMSFTLPV